MSVATISKSAFIKAEQCLKYFYLYKNHYYLRDPLSKEKQMVFKRGIDVGIYAQQLFPGGTDATANGAKNTEAFAQKTTEAIEAGATVIYEATFVYNGLLVMVDILVKRGDAWHAYEVKSSLKISETYVKDACFQYYVLKHALPGLEDFYLLTLNPQYVLDDKVDIAQLFKKRSVKKDAEKNLSYFEYKVNVAKEVLEQQKIPDIRIGSHCFSPYSCEFIGTCWKNAEQPESIFNLGKISKQELFYYYNNGQRSILQLDAAAIEKPGLRMQVEAVQQQKEFVSRDALARFLRQVRQPVCSIDIEVWTPAIPVYQRTRPFEQIPFLYALSSPDNEGGISSVHYLKDISHDLREEFLVSLLHATKPYATILMYDKTLEELVLDKCGELFPAHLDGIRELKAKIVDLFEPIDKGLYYHPAMKGNFSLKGLAPLMGEGSPFEALGIQSGIVAMYTYESLLNNSNLIDTENTREQLAAYCNLDAETTLRLFTYLQSKV